MFRRLVALSLCLLSTPVLAGFDTYTLWLQGQPLTHLDWIVFRARLELERMFERPEDEYSAARRSAFMGALSKRGLTYGRSYVGYDLDTNHFELFVLANKQGEPTQDDCATTLDRARDTVLRTFFYTANSSLADWERRSAAISAMSDFAVTPAAVGRKDQPVDLYEHLAALTSMRVTVNKADNILDGVSCTGSLGGADVNVRLKP